MDGKELLLITHVRRFIGPAAVARLLREDMTIACHDASFADAGARAAFEAEWPGAVALAAATPEAICGEAAARFGRLDALVSNDPYPAVRAPVDEADPDEFRRALEALTLWPYTLIGKAAAIMKRQGRGRILLITSAAPLTGIANYSIYAAARGAANALVPSLSRELARWNIPVNAIAPNYIKNPEYFPPDLLADAGAMGKMLKHIPLGRLGEPEEVAELVALFASGRCGFVTGQVLPVAGGWA
ncbi:MULTISPECIES: SDR family oxidoreductase [Rhodomicrobium]|uniref:SDR family oxidoreductase n=1 Tax=Rhodomicrobium TaxID=1068 RepID=UPI000B4AB473|nr:MULTISPECIES: SDR family oxidoreductase [Rhodomicrobium]